MLDVKNILLLAVFVVIYLQSSRQSFTVSTLLKSKRLEVCRLMCQGLKEEVWFQSLLRQAGCPEESNADRSRKRSKAHLSKVEGEPSLLYTAYNRKLFPRKYKPFHVFRVASMTTIDLPELQVSRVLALCYMKKYKRLYLSTDHPRQLMSVVFKVRVVVQPIRNIKSTVCAVDEREDFIFVGIAYVTCSVARMALDGRELVVLHKARFESPITSIAVDPEERVVHVSSEAGIYALNYTGALNRSISLKVRQTPPSFGIDVVGGHLYYTEGMIVFRTSLSYKAVREVKAFLPSVPADIAVTQNYIFASLLDKNTIVMVSTERNREVSIQNKLTHIVMCVI